MNREDGQQRSRPRLRCAIGGAHRRWPRRAGGMVMRLIALLLLMSPGAIPRASAASAEIDEDAVQEDSEKAAERDAVKIEVHGAGWWRNRQLRNTVRLLEPEDEPLISLDAAFVEDASVVLQSALEREGFLRSAGAVELRADGERVGEFAWEPNGVPLIPRDVRADTAIFRLDPGVRYTFEDVAFEGLAALDEDAAQSFFVEEGFLFGGGGTRRFSPAILRNGVNNLREQLVRMGYAGARVEVAAEERDDRTGQVRVSIRVQQGDRHRVASVQPPATIPAEAAEAVRELCARAADAVFSPVWQQDFVQSVRAAVHAHGYAEAEVRLVPEGDTDEGERVSRKFRLELDSGPQVRVGEVRFVGADKVAATVLERAIEVQNGELFDRSLVEQDRVQLGALGVFSAVYADVEKTQPDRWDLTYRVEPGKQLEVSLLLGYGSYEQLRGGVEVYSPNLFHHAHRGRLLLVQSMKASYGDYLYTVPQLFGTSTDASLRVFGLQRDEVSFEREEYGASIGARRRIGGLGADASLRYQYEFVGADAESAEVAATLPTDSRVAALTLDLTRDRLDNPIAPRRGYFLALTLETASKLLGGEVGYQRLDLRASWHRRVGSGQYVHAGLRHGLLWRLGGTDGEEIPLARRYFPGGEGTVRGFREGRAAPRATDGSVIGAEVSTVLNLEFEQNLARNLSAVAFVDTGVTAARLGDYPGDQVRVSVGVGLRYNTVIGPARLEYGHNVVRETGDAIGALHFALGFPF